MAATAVPRSRGVAGGLYFLFTLMCLLCLASSLMDKSQLKNLKDNLQKAQQNLDKIKAQRATFSELMNAYAGIINPLVAFLNDTSEDSPGYSLPLVEYMKTVKDFMKKTKTFVDEQNEGMDAEIEKTEKELGKMKKFVKALEESQAEL